MTSHPPNGLYTHGDSRPEDPRTQEAPYKNNLRQPGYAVVPGGECNSQGTRQSRSLSLTHIHTRSTWPDPNPAGRFYNRITEASCYCCSLHCPKTHNWIEEFMVFPLFFGLTVSPRPSIVFKEAICPARAPSSVVLPQYAFMVTSSNVGDCLLEVLFLN